VNIEIRVPAGNQTPVDQPVTTFIVTRFQSDDTCSTLAKVPLLLKINYKVIAVLN